MRWPPLCAIAPPDFRARRRVADDGQLQARRDEEQPPSGRRRRQPVVDAAIFDDALRVVAGHPHSRGIPPDAPLARAALARGLGEASSPKLAEARDDVVDVT